MLVNEQRDLLHQIPGTGNDGVFSFIYDAIHIEQQIIQRQIDGGIAPIAVGMKFLQKPDQTGLDGRKFCFVKMIIAAAGGGCALHQKNIVGRFLQQSCHIFLTDPQNKTPVRAIGAVHQSVV